MVKLLYAQGLSKTCIERKKSDEEAEGEGLEERTRSLSLSGSASLCRRGSRGLT